MCNYTASFNRKGKIGPVKQLEKDESAQQLSSKLTNWDAITEEDIQAAEGIACAMYEKKRFQFVDELRLELFLKKYKTNNYYLVDKMRKLDSALLLSCSRMLLKNLKRSSYIARLEKLFKCQSKRPRCFVLWLDDERWPL